MALHAPRLDAWHPARDAITQSLTTAAIRGTVRISDGTDPDGARVSVRNAATGFVVEVPVRDGRFLVQGLEVGGPYTVTVRRIGARAEQRRLGSLSLGEALHLHLVLEPTALLLDTLVAVAESPFPRSNVHGGTATTISDSLLHRLPSLNRDVYDFVRLVPQISTRVGLGTGGISGGGGSFRLNHFLTNGVPERSLAGGQPPEFAGGKSLPFEAVAEYQVLLAPFDVRYGDFAGAAVNTVTRSGSNRVRGSVFAQSRSDALARSDTALLPYDRWQYGLSLSGPIRTDLFHFLVAAEFQRLTAPMPGPFVGQAPGATPPVPVRETDLARLDTIMRSYGLDAGSGGPVPNRTPLRNVFARVDAALPVANSRAVVWLSDAGTRNLAFARGARDTTFGLSSHANTFMFGIRTLALQLHTTLARGGHNELFVSRRSIRARNDPEVRQPIVTVAVPGAAGAGAITVLTGTPLQAHGTDEWYRSVNLRDDLTLPLGGAHVASVGVEAEWFRLEPGGLLNTFGTWSFLSLDSLAAGLADRFEVTRDLGGGTVPLTGAQLAAYAGDRWLLDDRLSLTAGVRADLLTIHGRPPHNRVVDSIFGRQTDQLPRSWMHVSPRFGFTWDPGGMGRDQLRGGVGVFTGRPPLAWLHAALRAFGTGSGILRCGPAAGSQGPPPSFEPDPEAPPTSCGGGPGVTPSGDVELLDQDLQLARTLRGVLAWDRWLPGGILMTLEGLLSRNLSDFMFVNLNLAGPQSVDRYGRTLYGTFDPAGRASPVLRARGVPGVIDLQNTSANHSLQLSARLEKRFSFGFGATASYTWSRVRDVQTPLRVNTRGLLNWASRAVSGRHDDLSAGISLNDVPHRVALAGVYRAPWSRWTTELSFLYIGEAGSPFTYRASGLRGLGDLNADGSNANDPIYVPLSASNPDEISFTGVSAEPGADQSPAAQAARILSQQEAFERFIENSSCLRRQRGRILERNSCREPWSHTTVISLRQRVPLGEPGLEVRVDLFNALDLLNGSWGQRRVAAPALLEHVGQTIGPDGNAQPVFRFEGTASPWTVVPAESAYQLQFGIGYRF